MQHCGAAGSTCAFSQCCVRCQPVWAAVVTFSPEQEVTRMTTCAEMFTETGLAVAPAPFKPAETAPTHILYFILSTVGV